MNLPIVLASFSWPLFKQLLVVGIVVGSTYALLGVSFSVIYATTRVFHFAHAVVYAGSAYILVLLGNTIGLPFVVAVLGTIAFAIVLGVAIDRGVYRPMRLRNGTLLAIFLASLGLTIMGPNLIQIIFGPDTKLYQPISVHSYNLGSTTFTTVDIIAVVVSWICIIGTLTFLGRTKYGIATLAMRTNEEMSAAVGISPDRITSLVFALGSALVAVPAMVYMLNHGATPGMGLSPVLTGFIAVFLGGVGRTGGAALGGFLIGLITSLSGLWLSQDWQPAVVFGILFILLIARPRGILSGAGA
jgi:branched-chain amino acid transport system permease protein